ncbi:TLC domain-containing protein 4-B [Linum grandiflorum]
MTVPKETVMAIEAYRSQAKVLVKSYLFADPFVPYTSVLGGVVACKVVYDLTQLISTFYIKAYSGLTKMQRVEWNNRGMSSVHAVFITVFSLYFVFWSDLFSDNPQYGYVTLRSSPLSIFGLAVSVGYFLADLGMIFQFYPSLGGMEYRKGLRLKAEAVEKTSIKANRGRGKGKETQVVHHCLSAIAVAYSMLSGEGQLYTYMCLISEVTTPEINMRWYLDISGMKRSTTYLVNGVLIFLFWLIARVLLFFYIFYHINMHFDQVVQMRWFGCLVAMMVPSTLFIMNLMWFSKIIKGLMKTVAKKQ